MNIFNYHAAQLSQFLGQVTLPLIEMDQFERPRPRWFKLQSKPGHDKKDKDRGELEIRVSFTVKAGSLSDLSKKDGKKVSSSGGVGGSLLSLGSIDKRKSLSKFAKSLGSRMHVTGKKKKKDKGDDSDSFSGSFSSLGTPNLSLKNSSRSSGIGISNADPGKR
jgi:Rab11 family-interacting protein 1/2/5